MFNLLIVNGACDGITKRSILLVRGKAVFVALFMVSSDLIELHHVHVGEQLLFS